KKRKEDVPGMEENKLKKEYKELADNAKNLGGEIAGVNIEEEAKKKHEQDKNDEDYKRKIENAAAIKAENEDFKTERINGLLFPLFNEERNLKKEYYDKEEGKYKLGQGMYSPAEAAGLLASGLTLDEIKSIKLPVWGKIKIPFPREEERQFSSEAELEQYAIESLSNNIIEEAKKETDNYAVRAISLQMIKNVAETGNIEGRKEGPEVPLMSEKEMELKEPEKKPEVSEEVKNLMQEKLNEEISRLTAEFYDDFIMGKLKKDGKPVEIKEEEKTEFIIKRIKVDGEKNPEASQLKKELDDIVALKSGLSRKEPLPEANYLVLNYFWRKRGEAREEIPGRLRGDRPPLIKTKWEENSEIVRELAGCVSGRNIMKEVKRDLPEFLSEPKTAEQFKNELKNYIEKEKQSRSIARIDSLFPPEIAGQINETGELKIGKVILDKEEVIALVSSGCEAKDIMEAKPAFFSDKIKIGGKYFSKKDLESKKGELNSLIESLLEGEFQKKWETRAQRTLEENKIKELFKKEKAKEILGEDFSVEKSIKKIRSDIK
ncbi:MAG: hypothetical protein HYT36_03770, partial [Candidatus Staskawiczbacteria bacterium]|nr:hypothetical protein [Candidatus Staskawiczbacteria bacterium]